MLAQRIRMLAICLACNIPLFAQVTFFRSSADVRDGTGEVVTGYHLKKVAQPQKLTMTLVNDQGQEMKRTADGYWGFQVDSSLYRMIPGKPWAALVVLMKDPDGIIFYENGHAHLTLQTKQPLAGEIQFTGEAGYLSKGLDGDMYAMAYDLSTMRGVYKKNMKEFFERYPEYSAVGVCMNKNVTYLMARACVYNFMINALDQDK